MKLKKKNKSEKIDLINPNVDEIKRSKSKKTYKYKVKDKEGKLLVGYFGGYSEFDIQSYLINEGYEVLEIKTNWWISFAFGGSGFMTKRMSYKELIFFLSQLSTYIKSGITLTDSMRILSNQMGRQHDRKRIFDSIVYQLIMGESFSSALEKQGVVFPDLLINMLKAAEASGSLEETLDDMSSYYTEVDKIKKQMVNAIMYPAIITVFAMAVVTFIMLYVVPQFVDIYKQMGVEVSGLTKIVINLSLFLKNNIFTIFIFIFIFIFLTIFIFNKNKTFRRILQIFAMKIPVFSKIIIYNELSVLTKTFSSLLKNNVFITESVDILSKITRNEIYKNIMFKTINNISKGEKISESFKNHWAVPDVAYYMIVTGESTGELASTMKTVSEYYQELHRNIVLNLKTFIEPIMIVCLALVVGVIILSVIMPMFAIYEQISI